jgi:hypothetical protein
VPPVAAGFRFERAVVGPAEAEGRDRVLASRGLTAKKALYGTDFDRVGTPEAISAGIQRYAAVGSPYWTFHRPDAREISPIPLLDKTVVLGGAGF